MSLLSDLHSSYQKQFDPAGYSLPGGRPVSRRRSVLVARLWDSYIHQSRATKHKAKSKRLSEAGRRGNWKRWQRERAIVALQPTVEKIARGVRWMFAPHIELQDLVQAGNVGLVKAANSYEPSKGDFEAYAYFRVRGAIIDSQKRKVYREERNVSLHAIAEAHDGWLPPALDTDGSPRPDELAQRSQIERRLSAAMRSLPELDRAVLSRNLAGQPLAKTAKEVGRSLNWTRARLAQAQEQVAVMVRGS